MKDASAIRNMIAARFGLTSQERLLLSAIILIFLVGLCMKQAHQHIKINRSENIIKSEEMNHGS
jgi:hypothetical protein